MSQPIVHAQTTHYFDESLEANFGSRIWRDTNGVTLTLKSPSGIDVRHALSHALEEFQGLSDQYDPPIDIRHNEIGGFVFDPFFINNTTLEDNATDGDGRRYKTGKCGRAVVFRMRRPDDGAIAYLHITVPRDSAPTESPENSPNYEMVDQWGDTLYSGTL